MNRLTDDQTQERIRREAEAIEELIGFSTSRGNAWIGSVVLNAEISRSLDAERRLDAEALLAFVEQVVGLSDEILSRAVQLRREGFSEFDALHLACAEEGRADIFLSTDDRLVRRALLVSAKLNIRVLNPVSFLQELESAKSRND